MICIEICACCKNKTKKIIDGYIHTCKAFPEGIPDLKEIGEMGEGKECNNGVGFEPSELGMKFKGTIW